MWLRQMIIIQWLENFGDLVDKNKNCSYHIIPVLYSYHVGTYNTIILFSGHPLTRHRSPLTYPLIQHIDYRRPATRTQIIHITRFFRYFICSIVLKFIKQCKSFIYRYLYWIKFIILYYYLLVHNLSCYLFF